MKKLSLTLERWIASYENQPFCYHVNHLHKKNTKETLIGGQTIDCAKSFLSKDEHSHFCPT